MPPSRLSWPPKVDVLGVHISVTDCEGAAERILESARCRQPGIVTCQPVHGVVMGGRDPVLGAKMNAFDMITPDGQPVRWTMNLLGRAGLRDRVRGCDLTQAVCRKAAAAGVPLYLYGSSPEVLDGFRRGLLNRYPRLVIAGAESPPFRPLTTEEDAAMVARINASGASIVLVGLGCPKQDLFAYEHRLQIQAVQVCVGAVFDFFAGNKRTAPQWMQRCGLEWLFRLSQEPRRLWHRYLTTNSLFIVMLAGALLRRAAGLLHLRQDDPHASADPRHLFLRPQADDPADSQRATKFDQARMLGGDPANGDRLEGNVLAATGCLTREAFRREGPPRAASRTDQAREFFE